MRDFQRARLYRAEPPTVVEFTTLAKAVVFIQRVVQSRWWKSHAIGPWAHAAITVMAGQGTYAQRNHIVLAYWALNRHTILHELAHVAAGGAARHGPNFASMYLKLVRRFIGPEWARMLRESFIRNRVKFRARKVKQV